MPWMLTNDGRTVNPPAFCGGLIEAMLGVDGIKVSLRRIPPRFAGGLIEALAELSTIVSDSGESPRVLRGPH